eukprot:GHVT01010666.1.p1 GENE.GHVT01010666.1~~GHVT01010666.1.p1  ORF type:complete len:243 (+),score=35.55 GHVT01010666.1:739-1467(+)
MLLAPPTLFNLVVWQWINQSYNAIFNVSHGSVLEPQGAAKVDLSSLSFSDRVRSLSAYRDIAISYSAASGISVAMAVGLTTWLRRASLRPMTRRIMQVAVPYTAVTSAGVSNVALMRGGELKDGIAVYSPSGECMGVSRVAAKYALGLTAISRIIIPIPILAIPPPVIGMVGRWAIMQRSPLLKGLSELAVVYACLASGLPAAIALFPQQSQLPSSSLEEHLQHRVDKQGNKVDVFHFNKGL